MFLHAIQENPFPKDIWHAQLGVTRAASSRPEMEREWWVGTRAVRGLTYGNYQAGGAIGRGKTLGFADLP
jgi:hypothetical protein